MIYLLTNFGGALVYMEGAAGILAVDLFSSTYFDKNNYFLDSVRTKLSESDPLLKIRNKF
jgi:hypothetical protein